jgi:hypothetical protein
MGGDKAGEEKQVLFCQGDEKMASIHVIPSAARNLALKMRDL